MEPYVICQGDYLAMLAHKFCFDADAVWNDPANAKLRALRPDPNLLWPTDILYIPNASDRKPPTFTLVVGQTNTFTTSPPKVVVGLKFEDTEFASQSISITELPDLTESYHGE